MRRLILAAGATLFAAACSPAPLTTRQAADISTISTLMTGAVIEYRWNDDDKRTSMALVCGQDDEYVRLAQVSPRDKFVPCSGSNEGMRMRPTDWVKYRRIESVIQQDDPAYYEKLSRLTTKTLGIVETVVRK